MFDFKIPQKTGSGGYVTEVFVCDFVRTPFGRYGGALSAVRTDDLAAIPIAELTSRCRQIDWQLLDEVYLGCANQAGEDNRNVARMATLLAGLPPQVPAATINRLCGSGLDAILLASRQIKTGAADLIFAGGVESMSRAPLVVAKAETAFQRQSELQDTTLGWRFINPRMQEQYGVDSMAMTAEHVAAEFKVSREDQDRFAFESQQKAAKAVNSGRLDKEIISVEVEVKRGPSHKVEKDEHPRADTSLEKLSTLKPLYLSDGCVTAGNASGINDGAAAVLLASESAVEKYDLSPMARISGGATAGVLPRIMGSGPIPASQKLFSQLGLAADDFDLVEINEAFASQAIACMRELGIDPFSNHVNPNGGAIALGHPLGASGARIAGSASLELSTTSKKRALVTMCIGVGQGISLALEAV